MRTVAFKLGDQAELPVQVPLHGFTRVVGTFIGSAIAVAGRHRQMRFATLQRLACSNPVRCAALQYIHRGLRQGLQVGRRKAVST